MRAASSERARTAAQPLPFRSGAQTDITPYAVRFRSGERRTFGNGPPAFTLEVADEERLFDMFHGGAYSVAMAFLRGDIHVEGDFIAAVRSLRRVAGRGFGVWLRSIIAKYGAWRFERLFQPRSRAARNICDHYDRANEFWQQFLDRRLVYSCAYFKEPDLSLEEAQLAKLDHICRKLDLEPGERFLDVGCGWGALVLHAAEKYRVRATGCTLSRRQYDYAVSEAASRGLDDSVRILDVDYRALSGEFDKIASVGMFEHVGRRRLRGYFEKVASLLTGDGLFLNHGIVRPQRVGDDPESLFLKRHVFPGGELVHLADVVREAESSGFELLDLENLRLHYALTCRAWVERLRRRTEECVRLVGGWSYRIWLLYLAASADSFEQGDTDVHQVLLVKRSSHGGRHLTREHMYA